MVVNTPPTPQVEHTRNELTLLSSINSDFIVNLKCYFKDNSNIFLVLDVCLASLGIAMTNDSSVRSLH